MPLGEDPRHGLLVALVVGLVGLMLCIFAALAVAPVLMIVLGLMTYVVWWYVSREDTSYMHHAQEHENRFWTTVAFCFSGALIFVHDSPVAMGQYSPVLGFLFVMMFTFIVHSYDRQIHRSKIGRGPNFPRRVEGDMMLHSSAQDKCRRISLNLSKLDKRLVATNLNHMLWADMVQNLEKEIVNILSDADPSELNYMLPNIGLGLLFYKVKDHAPMNLHRTRLLNLLADTRISDLDITSRAHVLDALQQLKLSAHKDSETYAKKVILKTKDDELSELKSLTDAKGDIHSLHKLVYQDIKDVAIREEVLKHIANQARVQAAHMRLGTRTGSRRSGKAWRKILSDVDDTLTSSGGRFPAGVDSRYPRKSVYPGVLDFYRELDLGVNGPTEWPKGQLGNLVFLSARPHVYKDVSESKSYAKFKKLQDEKGLYTSPTLLAGSIDTGTTMLLTGNMEPVAEKKFQNFAEYVSLYPEFKHVFVGDNGQGDVRAAEMMAERYPGKLEAVYVHRVVPEEKTFGYQGAVTRQKWKKANIVFVGDYVEAACHAYKHGMIQAVGLQRVCQGAVEQFVDMKFEGPLERELQRRQINQSVWKANKLLQAANLEPNWLIRAVRAFDDMEAVLTPFGRGTVVNFRPEDGVYEVLLDWSQKVSSGSAAASRTSTKASTAPATPLASRSVQAAASQRQPQTSAQTAPPPRVTTPSRPARSPTSAAAGSGLAGSPSPPIVPPVAGVPASAAMPAPEEGPAGGNGGGVNGSGNNIDNPGLLLPAPSSMMPQRGPDAAGGGEAVRDTRVRSAARQAVTAAAAGSHAATAATVILAVSGGGSGGAEEAAGAPAAAAAAAVSGLLDHTGAGTGHGAPGQDGAPSTPLPRHRRNDISEESQAEQDQRAEAAAALTEAAAEAVRRSSHRPKDDGGGGGGAHSSNDEPMTRRQSAGVLLGGLGSGVDGASAFSPHRGEGDASWEPSLEETGMDDDRQAAAAERQEDGSVAAAAAKALSEKMPGSMAVRAYLQLPSLKKAPPEVKKVVYDAKSDDAPKSGRLSTRLSLFSRQQQQQQQQQQQDAGSAGSSRSAAARMTIAKGAVVQTLLGPATVRKVRAEDGMCEVSFHKWVLANGKPAFGIFPEATLVSAQSTVGKSPSLFGRTGKAISSLFKLSAVPTPAPPEPRVGDIVDTMFGPAAVTAVRGGPASKNAATPAKTSVVSPTARKDARKRDPRATAASAGAKAEAAPAAGGGDATSTPRRTAGDTPPSTSLRPPPTPPRPVRVGSPQRLQQQQRTPPRPTRPLPPRTPPSFPSTGDALPPPPSPAVFTSLSPLSPLHHPSPSPSTSSRRPRGASISVPGRDDHHEHPQHHHRTLSGGAAGDLLPGQLLSSPGSVANTNLAEQRGGGGRRASAPPSPAAVSAAAGDGFGASPHGADSDGEEDESEMASPLGVQILEKRRDSFGGGRRASAASPTDAVMYEVSFMKWRLNRNTPARAVLNRSSIWADWEERPPPGSTGRRRRTGLRRHSGRAKQSSRPSSFFGFMSMVGGLGGGTTRIPEAPMTDSPRKTGKSPAKPSAAPVFPCDFPPGACVKTRGFGPALVNKFRREDGIYHVSLLNWHLRSGGGFATAFLSREAIAASIAVPGTTVRTFMGPGRVELVREDGVAVVVVSSASDGGSPSSGAKGSARASQGGATLFLQLSAILGPAKATLGEKVDTSLGWGVVRAYHASSDTYVVDLGWGLVHSPRGEAIKERRPLAESTPLARSSGRIIKLFRWPLFGSAPSSSAAPFPPVQI